MLGCLMRHHRSTTYPQFLPKQANDKGEHSNNNGISARIQKLVILKHPFLDFKFRCKDAWEDKIESLDCLCWRKTNFVCLFVCILSLVSRRSKKLHLRYLVAEVEMSPIVFWTLQSPIDSGTPVSDWIVDPHPWRVLYYEGCLFYNKRKLQLLLLSLGLSKSSSSVGAHSSAMNTLILSPRRQKNSFTRVWFGHTAHCILYIAAL